MKKKTGFSHLDENGKMKMVDVSAKEKSARTAIARVDVSFEKAVFNKIMSEGVAKGDLFCVAKTAGIMAAKKTSELIPLCHPVFLSNCDIIYDIDKKKSLISIYSMARTVDYTGVEMEAITAALAAAATVYDMCKALSKAIVISSCELLYKSGGKSGIFQNKNIRPGDRAALEKFGVL